MVRLSGFTSRRSCYCHFRPLRNASDTLVPEARVLWVLAEGYRWAPVVAAQWGPAGGYRCVRAADFPWVLVVVNQWAPAGAINGSWWRTVDGTGRRAIDGSGSEASRWVQILGGAFPIKVIRGNVSFSGWRVR